MSPLRTYLARTHERNRTRTAAGQPRRERPGAGRTPAQTPHAHIPPLNLSIR